MTGATGAVGPSVVQALALAGFEVRILARTRTRLGLLPAGVDVVVGDVTDPTQLTRAMAGVDVVHHLAGVAHRATSERGVAELFEMINVVGTQNVARSANVAGVGHLVFYSTIAVYGSSRPGHILDEDSPVRPVGAYALSKARAEEVIQRELGTRATTLRMAAVIGPHMKANYRALSHAIARGRFVPVGAMSNRRTVVCEMDVGEAAVLISRANAARGKVFNVTDGEVHTLREIVHAMARAAARPVPRWHLPIAPLFGMAQAFEAVRKVGIPLPAVGVLLDKYLEDVAVSGERIQSELGFRPSHSLHACFVAAIEAQHESDSVS